MERLGRLSLLGRLERLIRQHGRFGLMDGSKRSDGSDRSSGSNGSYGWDGSDDWDGSDSWSAKFDKYRIMETRVINPLPDFPHTVQLFTAGSRKRNRVPFSATCVLKCPCVVK